ncbi:MAG: hypothetical protein IMZ53_10140 [Thermoplasmata archaeon]|nr:hypothetical protein [Thermoplasmata archaeon]
MATINYTWDANWTVIDAAIALTVAGTITDTSAEYDLSGKAACLISIYTTYSNHAKATAGLKISILRDVDDTLYETLNGAAISFEMPFTQAAAERKTIFLSAEQFQKFVLQQDWGNTTANGVATTATAIKYATITVA